MRHDLVIGWNGMPAYAARLIQATRLTLGPIPVIASRPVVPIHGMDEILPHQIHWIDRTFRGSFEDLKLKTPELFFQPSWAFPYFNKLGDEVRKRGGKVVVMFDNPWKGSLRQLLAAIRFRSLWKKRFDAAWVAGESGAKLARFWGFHSTRIFTGMYGADPTIFADGKLPALWDRPNRFLFVGRLIKEKGVLELLKAWSEFRTVRKDWELHIFGTGPLQDTVRAAPVIFHGFQQPEKIALAMREAKLLILPSWGEHWGLVACEAAQAGCGLLLSQSVGSALDLVGSNNGLLFAERNAAAIHCALLQAANWRPAKLASVQLESQHLGNQFTPERWNNTFHKIVNCLT